MFVINRDQCVCCHNCATECPAQAIDFVGTKYQIDQEKCLQCGLCAKVCHTCACHEVPEVPPVVAQHDPIIMECDVVVVGGGTGLIAAVRAAQMGKKVILLEKAPKLGGNTDYAHAYFPVYTGWHEKAGMEDCREQAIQHYRRVTDNVLEEDVLRTAVYGCGNFFDWLCTFGTCEGVWNLVNLGDADAHGPIYGPGLLDFPNRIKDNLNCRDDAIGPGWGGTHMKYTMLEAIEKDNLPVKIYTSTAAKHIKLDAEGKLEAIIAEDPGGEIVIKCKAATLACGGYGKSDEYMAQYCNFDFFGCDTVIHRFSVPTDTGDGITMLKELGVEPVEERMFVSCFGPKHHPFNNCIADYALEPQFIQVNINGQRWGNEEKGIMNPVDGVLNQPKQISYAILPYNQIKAVVEGYLQNPALQKRWSTYETWEADFDHEATLDTPVKKADTLEELAVLFGADPKVFIAEIEKYNSFCEKGVDEDFGKTRENLIPIPMDKGPYYAVYGQMFSEAAMGGVSVNGKCQVIRNDGTPIPGLYAGGDCTSAMHRKGELAPISELTWAVASNFTAGANMVAYIDGTEETLGGV